MADDELHGLLMEWRAPAPPPALEARILASAYPRHRSMRSVPVLAAVFLCGAAAWLAAVPAPVAPDRSAVVVTRIDGAGFEPLPAGEIRIQRGGVRR